MPIDPGLGTHSSSRAFQGFLGRWGIAGANLRSVWNTVFPVAIVDRYRGEEEGSLYALTAETPGALNEHPAIFFGAISEVETRDNVELEIIGISAGFGASATPPDSIDPGLFHVFTPIAPYNPVVNLNPVGVFIPGMFLNRAFTRGSGIAFAGTNPAFPAYEGAIGWQTHMRRDSQLSTTPNRSLAEFEAGNMYLPEPIRIHAGFGLAFQLFNPGSLILRLRVSLLYRQRTEQT